MTGKGVRVVVPGRMVHQEVNNNKALNLSEQTKGILYWKHFILLTLLFLGLEILLIRLI